MTAKAAKSPSGGREGAKVSGALIVLIVVGFVVAYQYVGPPPPKRIVMATGVAGGAYHAFGLRCAEVLARSGIEVELRETAGAIENLEALRNGEADIALVQGGMAPDDVGDFAKGVASVFFEPLWIFHRADLVVTRLTDLRGLSVQVGNEGSGTRAVALDLLALNGIDASNTTLLDAAAGEAADALLAGDADAMFLVNAPNSETIGRLAEEEGRALRLLDVDRWLAYTRRRPYLSRVILAEGVLDLERNQPARELDLVAPTAVLLAAEDLHSALVPLFIQASEETHGSGDLLSGPGSFPSPRNLEAPLAAAADHYFKHGSSFLYRVFPFDVAATLDRLKILLLPLLTLLLPVMRLAPPLIRWRTRRKVFRWYRHLERIEREPETDHASRLAQLDEIEREIVETVDVPASYMEELHQLRLHLERVRARLDR